MAVTHYTLTAKFTDLLGTAYNPNGQAVTAWIETNVAANEGIVDDVNDLIELGPQRQKAASDGTVVFANLIGSDSATADINIATGTLQYRVTAEYINALTRKRGQRWTSGWFSLTANTNLADVVAEQYVPAEFITQATADLQAMIDQGLQGPQGIQGPQGVPGGTDAATAGWVSSGPLTSAATDARVDALVPASTTTVQGKVELATTSETTTGTDAVRAVTPAGAKAVIDARATPLVRPTILPATTVLARPFDARRSIYNARAANGKIARAGLARTQTLPRLLRIAAKGDSITRGVSYASPTYAQSTSYPRQLRNKLKALGYRCAGDGFVIPNGYDANMTDSRWTYTAGSTSGTWQTAYETSGYLWSIRSNGVCVVTFTSSEPCTRVAITHNNGIGAAATVKIDGATPGAGATITPNGSSTIGVTEYTGLANTTHTVEITTTGTFALHGIDCTSTTGDAAGFVIDNYGRSGASTLNWHPTNASPYPTWRNHDALAKRLQVTTNNQLNVSLIQLGTNDALRDLPAVSNGQLPADYKTNMAAIIESSMAVSETMLIAPYQIGNYRDDAAGMAPYNEALYQLADTYNLRLLDMADRWVDYTTALNTSKFISLDVLHPAPEGYFDYADGALALLGAS